MSDIHNKVCLSCGIELTTDNCEPNPSPKARSYICKECHRRRLQEHHDFKAQREPPIRKRKQHLTMSENRKCSLFLGVYIGEGVLCKVFKNVEKMPLGNHGYDFICNRGKKIDVKASCRVLRRVKRPPMCSISPRRRVNTWSFSINHNTVADYFLCIAFSDRETLTPLHLWLIPGGMVNDQAGISISESTLSRWEEYELDVGRVIDYCDKMGSPE